MANRKLPRMMSLAIVLVLLAGCGAGQVQPPAQPSSAPPSPVPVATAPLPSAPSPSVPPSPVPTEATEPPAPAATLSGASLVENTTGKTVLSRANRDTTFQTTYMIISKSGTVIVVDPFKVVEGIRADIITVSHSDYDHNDARFKAANDCRKSLYTVETFTVKDVTVTSIASSHSGDDIYPDSPSNVIYVFDVDGLRIAAMGDIAQSALTPAQLEALGQVDIVFMMSEHLPQYGYTKEKTLNILKQLNPRLILPTHPNQSVLEALKQQFVDETLEVPVRWAVSKEDLQDGKRRLLILGPLPE